MCTSFPLVRPKCAQIAHTANTSSSAKGGYVLKCFYLRCPERILLSFIMHSSCIVHALFVMHTVVGIAQVHALTYMPTDTCTEHILSSYIMHSSSCILLLVLPSFMPTDTCTGTSPERILYRLSCIQHHAYICWFLCYTCKVGQNHIYTVYIRFFWQGNHQYTAIYGAYIYGSGQPYIHALC